MAGHRITWSEEDRRGGPLHIARHQWPAGEGWDLHRHEFAEVFWLEAGNLRHAISNRSEDLTVGHLACVRPDDFHSGVVLGRAKAAWINISFPVEPVAELARRYGPEEWPWAEGGPAKTVQVGSEALERLRQWTTVLSSPAPRRLDLESFLLEVARLVSGAPELPAARGLPAWLREALPVFADERHLVHGVPRLAVLTDVTMAHLNRVVRKCQDRTATELVTELRLDHAANQLRLSNRSIAEIAEAVGLANLGHFYRRFHGRFVTTPKAYRDAAWGMMPR